MPVNETYTTFRFLKPVSQIPKVKRKKRSIYKKIIREFMASGLNYAEVKNIGKNPQTIYAMLTLQLKRENIRTIRVHMRNKRVYLEKVEMQDFPLNNFISEPDVVSEKPDHSPRPQPIIDIMRLLNTYIVKLRCPKCRALNAKDARFCRDCSYNFYADEEEYRYSLEKIEELETKLNSKENEMVLPKHNVESETC